MAALGSGTMLVATKEGVSLLQGKTYTLEKKAAHYQAMAHPRHSRYGYSRYAKTETL
jgi:hypothetical protein